MASYFESQKGHIFAQVHVLIYVFDIESIRAASQGAGDASYSRDAEYFVSCLKALQEHSKNVTVFCLIHKMDLVDGAAEQERVFKEQQANLRKLSEPYVSDISCFPTSIWDASLYRAWSSMVHSLIPNVATLESQLNSFCQVCKLSSAKCWITMHSCRPFPGLHELSKNVPVESYVHDVWLTMSVAFCSAFDAADLPGG